MWEGLSLWTGNIGLSMVMHELSLEYQRVRDLKDVLSHHLAVGGGVLGTHLDRQMFNTDKRLGTERV